MFFLRKRKKKFTKMDKSIIFLWTLLRLIDFFMLSCVLAIRGIRFLLNLDVIYCTSNFNETFLAALVIDNRIFCNCYENKMLLISMHCYETRFSRYWRFLNGGFFFHNTPLSEFRRTTEQLISTVGLIVFDLCSHVSWRKQTIKNKLIHLISYFY